MHVEISMTDLESSAAILSMKTECGSVQVLTENTSSVGVVVNDKVVFAADEQLMTDLGLINDLQSLVWD